MLQFREIKVTNLVEPSRVRAQFSKYDFWNLGEIGIEIGEQKISIDKHFVEKIWQKKSDEKKNSEIFLKNIFQSQMFQRFQKPYLENCAMRPGIRVPVIKKVVKSS